MPRRSKKSSNGSKPESVSGRTLFTIAATTASTISLSPASFPRALAISDVYQFYRFTKANLMVIPQDTNITAGYAPGAVFDTPPSVSSQVLELPQAVFHGSGKFNDTWLRVPRKELLSDAQIPWFKTIPGTPATQFEIQGNFYIVSGATSGLYMIEWTVEFQSWNLAANSPLSIVPKVEDKAQQVKNSGNPTDSLVIGGVTYKKSQA
jgi:hypothetical protein